jgi:hypothetical protein
MLWVGRGEEPVEEAALFFRVVADWQKARVRLADIELDIGDGAAVHGKL